MLFQDISIAMNWINIPICSTERDIPQFISLLGQLGGLAKVFITLLTTYSMEILKTVFSRYLHLSGTAHTNIHNQCPKSYTIRRSYQIAVNKDYLRDIIIGIIIDKAKKIKNITQVQKSSKCKNCIRLLKMSNISYECLEKLSKTKHITILVYFVV